MAKKNRTDIAEVDFAPAAADVTALAALDKRTAEGLSTSPSASVASAVVDVSALLSDAGGFSVEKYFSLSSLEDGKALVGIWEGESGTVPVSDPNDPNKIVDMPVGKLRVDKRVVLVVKAISGLLSQKPGSRVAIVKGGMVETRRGRMARDWTVLTADQLAAAGV